ncbi:AAA domain-containing protein [Nonomuraea sp. NPDC050202]|uniref:DEAD/DEAH box helicase n=1 Tax=Nonomuraea sp. NPDC050202 TaxID=3155035 RepID=UPI0033F4CEF3
MERQMHRASEKQRQTEILRFWRTIEYFSPPRVDRVDSRKHVYAAGPHRPLPWEAKSALPAPRQNFVWRHTVYLGVYEMTKVRDLLQNVFRAPEDEQDFDGRIGGQSAIVSFTVDETGQLLKESPALSSCAWAVSRTLTVGPHSADWLEGFDQAERQILGVLLEVGDDRVQTEPIDNPAADDPFRRVFGTAVRLALDTVGSVAVQSLSAAVKAGGGPVAGTLASTAVEKVGDHITSAAVNAIAGRLAGDDGSADGDPSESEPSANVLPAGVGARPLTLSDLVAMTRWLAEELQLLDALEPVNIRVKSYQVSLKRADDAQGDEFLNSFYADDLQRISSEIKSGRISIPLAEYLRDDGSIATDRRIDLRREPHEVLNAISPFRAPAGRWPGPTAQPLALSQQFAINQIWQELGHPQGRGIYAVNGPPGTGKTTMLRDLIAAIVVARAEELAKLKNPGDAFMRTSKTWQTEDASGNKRRRELRPLVASLEGFEIVVASSNNGAVENITLEVPGIKAIAQDEFSNANYLAGPATLLTENPCWGAIAARLGRRSFRSEFVDRFWWGSSRGRPAAKGSTEEAQRGDVKGLRDLLTAQDTILPNEKGSPEPSPLGDMSWREAVTRFNRARSEVRRLTTARESVAAIHRRAAGPDAHLQALERTAQNAAEQLHTLEAELYDQRHELARHADGCRRQEQAVQEARAAADSAGAQLEHANRAVGIAESFLHQHDRNRPGFFRRMMSRTATQSWERERIPYMAALADADTRARAADAAYWARTGELRTAQSRLQAIAAELRTRQLLTDGIHQKIDRITASLASTEKDRAQRQAELAKEDLMLREARERWKNAVPGDEWTASADDREAMRTRERSAPWMDPELAAARSRLFLAALDLHRAVLASEPALVRRSLDAVMDVVRGACPADLDPPIVLAAWRLLFFVVPVVSTTFASIARMFKGIEHESLGWLFIDEAGQASPQEAVGALWRARRAIVVGDPLQLEPVVTLPWTAQKRLCRHFGVDSGWAPSGASVQTVADRLNRFGTWLPAADGSGPTWVGSPLRVHRRCDRLMFEISNRIAYDNMMVFGVDRTTSFAIVERHVWIDVGSSGSDSKWNPLEGKYALATINTVRERTIQAMQEEVTKSREAPAWAKNERNWVAEVKRRVAERVFVVSPFRDVVRGLNDIIGVRLPPESKRVGTVHTTQGKEADVVILVLGAGGPQRGTRDWAAKSPNLLNVAVTRARRRLVVIGDYKEWSKHRFFSTLTEFTESGELSVVTALQDWKLGKDPSTVDWNRLA